jgi:hypothetical protein
MCQRVLVLSRTTHMGRILKALISTVLIIEIATIFSETSVWALVSELHLPGVVMMPALALTGLGMLVLGVQVFRMALRSERRMEEDAAAAEDAAPELPVMAAPGRRNPNEIEGTARPRAAESPPEPAPPPLTRDRSRL